MNMPKPGSLTDKLNITAAVFSVIVSLALLITTAVVAFTHLYLAEVL